MPLLWPADQEKCCLQKGPSGCEGREDVLEVRQGKEDGADARGGGMKAFFSVLLIIGIICALFVGILVEAQPTRRDLNQWKLNQVVNEWFGLSKKP